MTKLEQIQARLQIADEEVLGRETNDSPANNYHIAWSCYVNLVPYSETLERRIVRALSRRDEEVRHLVKIVEFFQEMIGNLECSSSPTSPCQKCHLIELLSQ